VINAKAVKAVFVGSLKLKPTESCLIVTDTIKEEISRAFFEYAKRITKRAKMLVMDPTDEHGAEPPEKIAHAMLQNDVLILITEKSLTHTLARREATARGARIATMPSITEDIANRCLDIDYEELKRESARLHAILKESKELHMTTDLGTDITFSLKNTGFFGKAGGSFDYPGAFGNLPEGEVAFLPRNGEGIFIVDASFPDIGILSSPISFHVRGGVVYEITGHHAEEVVQRLDKVGPRAYRIAELGIGLNPNAKIIGKVLEDEKVIGTAHIALGNDLSFGGKNDVPLHLDGVIMSPTIYVDGKVLMEKGDLRIGQK
jgi:leucyl aminopeptidase (aminopeptidase T)